MANYILRRTAGVIITLFVLVTLVFILLRVTSDPVAMLVTGEATQEQYDAVRKRMGLDRPIAVQYVAFLKGVVTGQMDASYRYDIPAMQLVLQRVKPTLVLSLTSFVLAILVAFPLGILAAAFRGSWLDHLASGIAFLGFAVPAFWLGSVLIIIFGVQLRWFPTSGDGTLAHLVLPSITLALWPIGQLTRLIRSELLNVMSDDYTRTAHAKGVGPATVLIKHALRNALLPVVTLMSLLFGTMLGGAVVTETIFAWPGLGRLTLEAALNRDFPLIEAGVVFLAAVFNVLNLVTDLTYALIDPRVQVS